MGLNIDFDTNGHDTTYLTHGIHPYPAKFPPQLPKSILEEYAKRGDIILDPFCGSGTTNVEARLHGYDSIGIDINGLSTLLTKVKSTPLNKFQIELIYSFFERLENDLLSWNFNRPEIFIKTIEAQDHWFQKNVSEEITHILNNIKSIEDEDISDFLKISLSSIIVKVSNQDSDTRFVAKDKKIEDLFTLKQFLTKSKDYLLRIIQFSAAIDQTSQLDIFNADSREISFLEDKSINIIITSPPYANTYDYYLYHKSRKRWLDIDVKFAQNNEIGSRREYSSLKRDPVKWENDLILCFSEMHRVLANSGMAFVVIGDSFIQKELVKIDEVITKFAPAIGFKILQIISTDLAGHSRIFNPSFAQKGKKEHLIILRRV
jgi:site-specific DNA-methyltransferase (cytosine-N4-specific)